jgi:hypothetical protein
MDFTTYFMYNNHNSKTPALLPPSSVKNSFIYHRPKRLHHKNIPVYGIRS